MKNIESKEYAALIGFSIGLMIMATVWFFTSCDSYHMDEAEPNYSPYTQITITQTGDTLTVNTNADKFYWYDYDRVESLFEDNPKLRLLDITPNDITFVNYKVWDFHGRVIVVCFKGNNATNSNIKFVQ